MGLDTAAGGRHLRHLHLAGLPDESARRLDRRPADRPAARGVHRRGAHRRRPLLAGRAHDRDVLSRPGADRARHRPPQTEHQRHRRPALFAAEDTRRDAAFSIFYMGINVGGFFGPIITGFLAQSDMFRARLVHFGLDPNSAWHWGFGAAGVGMTLGLVQYVLGGRALGTAGLEPVPAGSPAAARVLKQRLVLWTRRVWPRPGAGVALAIATHVVTRDARSRDVRIRVRASGGDGRLLRLAVSRSQLDADRAIAPVHHRRVLRGRGALLVRLRAGRVNAQSVRRSEHDQRRLRTCVSQQLVAVAQLAAHLRHWRRRSPGSGSPSASGSRPARRSSPSASSAWASDFSCSCPRPSAAVNGAQVGISWLFITYTIHTIAEMCLSPVGLSSMTKLAPERIVSLMMGVWFLGASVGNFLGGQAASFYEEMPLGHLLGIGRRPADCRRRR